MQDRPGTVLVVDDEESIRFSLQHFLKAEGYRVLLCQTYTEACEVFSRETVDVAIIDYTLKGHFSGVDLIPVIKIFQSKCAIIMMSAHWMPEQLTGQAFRFLSKPFNREDFLEMVHQAMASHACQL